MIKAVIFDLYETLITEWVSDKYLASECAADLGIGHELFRSIWESYHSQMNDGTCTYRQALQKICEAAGKIPTTEELDLCEYKRISSKSQCFENCTDEIPAAL